MPLSVFPENLRSIEPECDSLESNKVLEKKTEFTVIRFGPVAGKSKSLRFSQLSISESSLFLKLIQGISCLLVVVHRAFAKESCIHLWDADHEFRRHSKVAAYVWFVLKVFLSFFFFFVNSFLFFCNLLISSLYLFSLPRNAFTSVLYYLTNLVKHIHK